MIRKELVAVGGAVDSIAAFPGRKLRLRHYPAEVKACSGGKLQWTDGMLYPVLHRSWNGAALLKSRWGESENGRKRKYYSLKKDGKTALDRHHQQWSLIHSVLAGCKKEQYV